MATYNQVSYGSSGDDVKELQKLLNQNGYELEEDGIFGSKTQSAVQDYQKKNNLDGNGIVGDNTWGALTGANATATPSTTPTTTPTTPAAEPWSYDEFQVSESTAAADQKRQEVASQKPGDFSYGAYEKSDTVKQAEALLQQQLASKPGAYESQWQTQLDDTLNKILNREKFTYDLNGDALYQQYKDQYVQQGQQAMMDTMGQAAALTGGYGNSYAQTAGQQTYQGYLQQLNERIPELYQLALDQYNREGEELYNQYGLYADRDDRDYGRYRDTVSDYYTELDRLTDDARYQSETDYNRYMDGYNMAYGQHRDQVSDWQHEQDRADAEYWAQYERDYGQYSDDRNLSYDQYLREQEMAYQQERDKVSDEQWQAEFDEAKRQYDQAHEIKTGGSKGSSGSGDDNTPTADLNPGEEPRDYNNQGFSDADVELAQQFVGADPNGKWGSDSEAKAKAMGYDSIVDVIAAAQTTNQHSAPKPQKNIDTKKVDGFIQNLPYAHAGSGDAWKKYVDNRLEKSDLTDDEKVEVMKRLKLF